MVFAVDVYKNGQLSRCYSSLSCHAFLWSLPVKEGELYNLVTYVPKLNCLGTPTSHDYFRQLLSLSKTSFLMEGTPRRLSADWSKRLQDGFCIVTPVTSKTRFLPVLFELMVLRWPWEEPMALWNLFESSGKTLLGKARVCLQVNSVINQAHSPFLRGASGSFSSLYAERDWYDNCHTTSKFTFKEPPPITAEVQGMMV